MSANEICMCIDCQTEYPIQKMKSLVTGMSTLSQESAIISVGTCLECANEQ